MLELPRVGPLVTPHFGTQRVLKLQGIGLTQWLDCTWAALGGGGVVRRRGTSKPSARVGWGGLGMRASMLMLDA
jgi:hypothetical protein